MRYCREIELLSKDGCRCFSEPWRNCCGPALPPPPPMATEPVARPKLLELPALIYSHCCSLLMMCFIWEHS